MAWVPMSWLTTGCALLLGLMSFTCVACHQAEGETCQINSDCEDGLTCCIAPTAARGTCAANLDRCNQQPVVENDAGGE
jgi:hypothetical protein